MAQQLIKVIRSAGEPSDKNALWLSQQSLKVFSGEGWKPVSKEKEEIFIEVVDMNVNNDGEPSGILICQDAATSKKIYDIVDSGNEVYVKYIDPVLGEVGINVPKGCHKTQSSTASFMQYEGKGYSASIVRHIENLSDGIMDISDKNIEIFITESFITISKDSILNLLVPSKIIFTYDRDYNTITIDKSFSTEVAFNLSMSLGIVPEVVFKYVNHILSGIVTFSRESTETYHNYILKCTFFYEDSIITISYNGGETGSMVQKQLSFVE